VEVESFPKQHAGIGALARLLDSSAPDNSDSPDCAAPRAGGARGAVAGAPAGGAGTLAALACRVLGALWPRAGGAAAARWAGGGDTLLGAAGPDALHAVLPAGGGELRADAGLLASLSAAFRGRGRGTLS
jgi:hypothetical protein